MHGFLYLNSLCEIRMFDAMLSDVCWQTFFFELNLWLIELVKQEN